MSCVNARGTSWGERLKIELITILDFCSTPRARGGAAVCVWIDLCCVNRGLVPKLFVGEKEKKISVSDIL